MMNAWIAILIDTNILVYVHDPRDRVKCSVWNVLG